MRDDGTLGADDLIELARNKSTAGRARLAEIVTEMFDSRGDTLSDRERELMFGILKGIIHEVEVDIRRNISDHLANQPGAPPELVKQLADDVIDVAYPVLVGSGVLKDSDLIEVIRMRSLEHQLAVTLRAEVSEQVSDALVETNHPSVIESLLNNKNAKISATTLGYLVEESRRVDTFREPLVHRHDLPPALAGRMFSWVSLALRQHIIGAFDIDPAVVDSLIEKAVLEESDAPVPKRRGGSGECGNLVDLLRQEGMVEPNMLITALAEGEVALFISLFCRLTTVKEYLAKRVLFESGGEGLAIACKSAAIEKVVFASIFTLSRKTSPATARTVKKEIPKILRMYGRINEASAREVVDYWNRGGSYTNAIREIKLNE